MLYSFNFFSSVFLVLCGFERLKFSILQTNHREIDDTYNGTDDMPMNVIEPQELSYVRGLESGIACHV